MAAKKSAARKVSAKRSATKTVASVVEKATEAVKTAFRVEQNDPRPDAWRTVLLASANGEPPPRRVRVYMDGRFTGKTRIDQVKIAMKLGNTVEDAVDAVLEMAMEEHRGEKHCDW